MGWLLLCLHLLLFHFISSSSSHFLCHPDQSSALLQFKASFTIDNTDIVDGGCPHKATPEIATWENGTDCCSWRGVNCDPISGHVLGLNLSCNGLQGMIHPNSTLFSHLTHLTYLNLMENNIGGEIPSSLSSLRHLTHLDFSENKFSGQIPDVFGELTKLQSLSLSSNNLEGQIPSSLFHLTSLSFLDCGSNKLEGSLPDKITGLSNLTILSLKDNSLNGTIPSWCLSLPSLEELNLSNNQFTGHISAIPSYSLRYLLLCNNNLQGNFLGSIFNLVDLVVLCLSSNNLSGSVNFSHFCKFQNLQRLSLSHNSQLSLNFESEVDYIFFQLIELDLSSLSLAEFPKLRKNPFLMYLDLSNNKLSGRVPNWLQEMAFLTYLDLSQNLFTSMDQISSHYSLNYLDLSFNSLVGEISSSICKAKIRILDLSHNKLTGIIPQCLANLTFLQVLDLEMNKLYGILPSTFSSKLRTLNFNGNQLGGLLPKSLSNCTNLEVLNLGNNQIEDTFPYWLQTLPYLKVLVLRANKFHGLISNLKTQNPFPNLIIFDISDNDFNGPLPKAYIKNFEAMKNVDIPLQYMEKTTARLNLEGLSFYDSVTITTKGINLAYKKIPTSFVTIDLSANKFEGEIPYVIGELQALRGLNLSHNRLIGLIPQSMGNLTYLESLDLSSNMLNGVIPTELTNLNFLAVLNLSQNYLEGAIPRGKQFDTFSNDSYVGNLGLCGLPLSKNCSNKDPEQHSPPSATSEHEQKFGFGWQPVAIGYGCGMVFGVGLGCCALLIGKPQWLVRMFGGKAKKRMKRRTRMRAPNRMNQNQLVQMS